MLDRLDAIADWTERRAPWLAAFGLSGALLVRLIAAGFPAMNPDEAMNFVDANGTSLIETARFTMAHHAHPPLAFMVTWLFAGVSLEPFFLRLPSVLASTATAALAYHWIRSQAGPRAALIGLLLFGFALPLLDLGAETRGYALTLICLLGALVTLERGSDIASPKLLVVSGLLTAGAIASHYSGIVAALSLGFYGLWLAWRSGWPRGQCLAWAAGQAFALGTLFAFWALQINQLYGGGMESTAQQSWLKESYFLPGSESPLEYLLLQPIDFVTYAFEIEWIGWLALAYGSSFAVFGQRPHRKSSGVDSDTDDNRDELSNQHRALLIIGVLTTIAVALTGTYPFGGTRHSAYLTIFVFVPLATSLGALPSKAYAVILVGLLSLSVYTSADLLERTMRDGTRLEHVEISLDALAEGAPSNAIVFTSKQTAYQVRFELCPNARPAPIVGRYSLGRCGPIELGMAEAWMIDAPDFHAELDAFKERFEVDPSRPIYTIFVAGWDENLVAGLDRQGVRLLDHQTFSDRVTYARVPSRPHTSPDQDRALPNPER